MDNGDADRAIRNLQMIELRDHEYVHACRLLGEIFTSAASWISRCRSSTRR